MTRSASLRTSCLNVGLFATIAMHIALTFNRTCVTELLVSHVKSNVALNLPMDQKLNYLSPFTSGPSNGTRSKQAHIAHRPTNLSTILESNEKSKSGPSKHHRVNSPPRLHRFCCLAPIYESEEESKDGEITPDSIPPHPQSNTLLRMSVQIFFFGPTMKASWAVIKTYL